MNLIAKSVTGLRFEPPVIAHRGASAAAPENTIAAFERAYAEGARWIETDVKLTRDGVPVLFHDDTLDRTTNGTGAIAEIDWAQLRELDAGSWFNTLYKGARVPRLSDGLAFALKHKMRFNLELKPCPGRTQATVMVAMIEIAKHWPENAPPPLLSSFDTDALAQAAKLHPQWPRGLLLNEWQDDWPALVRKTGASLLHINADRFTPDQIAVLRKLQMPLLAYTVNDPLRARELLHSGITAVFCDRPKAIIPAL